MKIDVEKLFIFALGYEFFWVKDLVMSIFVGVLPLPVEVVAWERSTVAAIDDSVWVEHGYDLYDELVPHFFSAWMWSAYFYRYDRRKRMSASHANEEIVSPGWARAVMHTTFLLAICGLVMSTSSTTLSEYFFAYLLRFWLALFFAFYRYVWARAGPKTFAIGNKYRGSSRRRKLHHQCG